MVLKHAFIKGSEKQVLYQDFEQALNRACLLKQALKTGS